MRYDSLIQSTGNTPLVRLRGAGEGGASLYAKLEMANPLGHKDRFARYVIEKARASGQLKEGGLIMESSSGTLGLGLAMVGRALGHPVHLVTDPRTDALTLNKLRALGAVLHFAECPDEHGWQGARLKLLEWLLQENPGAFWPMQYSNPDNPRAYAPVAQELLAAIGRIDVLVTPVGSGGLLSGTARVLRETCPNLKVVAVDVAGSVIFDQPHGSRLLNGIGNSLVPPNVEKRAIDEVHWVTDNEGFAGCLRLAQDELIFAGGSSGAAYWVARWLAGQEPADSVIVVIFPDRGDRYGLTIYDEQYRASQGVSLERLPEQPERVAYGTPVAAWSYAAMPEQDGGHI